QSGGVVWFTPEMRVTYRPRSNVRALARQYHDYGRWRREVARRHPETLSPRYLAAPAAVSAVAGGLVVAALGAVTRKPSLIAPGLSAPFGYAIANLVASAVTASATPRLSWPEAVRLPAVYATMHGSWGVGFLRGVDG